MPKQRSTKGGKAKSPGRSVAKTQKSTSGSSEIPITGMPKPLEAKEGLSSNPTLSIDELSQSTPLSDQKSWKNHSRLEALERNLDNLASKLSYLEEKYREAKADVYLALRRADEAERRAIDAEIQVKALERSTHTVQYMPPGDLDTENPYETLGNSQLDREIEATTDALFNPSDEPLEQFEIEHLKEDA